MEKGSVSFSLTYKDDTDFITFFAQNTLVFIFSFSISHKVTLCSRFFKSNCQQPWLNIRNTLELLKNTGIPHFITLFIALHRCCFLFVCFFFQMKARPFTSKKIDLLYCDTRLIMILTLLHQSGTELPMSLRYASTDIHTPLLKFLI